jgi:uncharacterized protein YjlB
MTHTTDVIHGHIATHIFEDDGRFPNNPNLPVLVYKGALHLHPGDEIDTILELFKKNNWENSWKDSVFDYDHYHSTTHEVLGVFCGTADITLGGPEGTCVELVRGDVVIIPAGVAHKNLKCSHDFLCVGAYPEGRSYDMKNGNEEDREKIIREIASVPIPSTDPVFGSEGPLLEYWKKKPVDFT